MTTQRSADTMQSAGGRQYHTGVAPGDVARTILLVGDPARAHRMGGLLANPSAPIINREYVTISGTYQQVPLTVMATGMGPDNTEMAVVEISQVVKAPTFIRIGTTGALQPHIQLGDLVISTGAVRCENTSTAYVPDGYPAVAHHEVTLALLASATAAEVKFHAGITATGSGFYGAQGRHVPGFPPRRPELLDELARMGVCNFEMETSCLFTLATLSGARAGAVCGVVAQRTSNVGADESAKARAEAQAIEVGLGAAVRLAAMDAARGTAPYWLPSMGGS